MKNGIYGLASLNGAPLDRRDRAILALEADRRPLTSGACVIHLQDTQPAAIHVMRTEDGFCALLGHLDEPEDVADSLGLDRRTDSARLAAAAHDRWGAEMATRLLGEWLMVRWRSSARQLTLVMGECVRDHCYVATNGAVVAFAPELRRLARLSWVGADFDPDMLLRSMGPYAMRQSMDGETFVKGVSLMRPGEHLVIEARGLRRGFAEPVAPPPLRPVAFEDAIHELHGTLDRILRQQLERSGDAAFLLSGGLDSSLLAALGADAMPKAARMFFLTSASPAGSPLEDETRWAALVSQHLGIPMHPVTPGPDADIYRPCDRMFEAFEAPLQSPRHYLYEALENAALDGGARAIVDGMFGELTVSNDPAYLQPAGRLDVLRRLARSARDFLRFRDLSGFADGFLVRPSRAAVADHLGQWAGPEPEPRPTTGDGAHGFRPGAAKAAQQPSHCSTPALRGIYPFRDRRLVRLMAAYPAAFARHGGQPRAPVRSLMHRRLPSAIVNRDCKLGFSPTYSVMLRDKAGQALARLTDEPVAQASDWIDIVWLKAALTRMSQGAPVSKDTEARVQATAVAVEFFRWWRTTQL